MANTPTTTPQQRESEPDHPAKYSLLWRLLSKTLARLILWTSSILIALGVLGPVFFLLLAGLLFFNPDSQIYAAAGSIAGLATLVFAWFWIRPWLAPGLDRPVRSGYRHDWIWPDSIAQNQQATRYLLVLLSACQFLCAFIGATLLRSMDVAAALRDSLGDTAPWLESIVLTKNLAAAGLLALGGLVLLSATRVFLITIGDSIRRQVRGNVARVQLMDFIAEWDNPSRRIFTTCPYSRRFGLAHRSILWTAAGCFAIAGSVAVVISDDQWLGELIALLSIGATMSLWPTPPRLVRWSKRTLRKLSDEGKNNNAAPA